MPGATTSGVTATANPGYQFTGWSGASTSTASSAPGIVMDGPKALTANFGKPAEMVVGARILPATYTPSKSVNVSIGIVPGQSAPSYAVEDQPPLGWTVSDINEGGVWDDSDKKVKWGPFSDTAMRLLTYKATPPAGESGSSPLRCCPLQWNGGGDQRQLPTQ